MSGVPSFPVYLFDIDGTLLDSALDICGAVQQVLDATEIKLLVQGKPLPKVVPPKDEDSGVQQVLKPEPGRTPVIAPERPAQA